jgi:hypothetical protein
VIRFIPNEEVLKLNEEETRRARRNDQRFDQEISWGICPSILKQM